MDKPISKSEHASPDPLGSLQREIALLEAELSAIEKELGAFEAKIHARLDREITRVRELHDVYKQQKREKKAKRLEQKKRGKNWVEPRQLQLHTKAAEKEAAPNEEEQKALKRLYKEAVVQVHPDKFVHAGEEARIKRANAITAQLNLIYKRGDLEELIAFYEQIMGEQPAHENFSNREVVPDARLRQESLIKKKEGLLMRLSKIKSSYTYQVLTTYDNPLSFIDELYLQFLERIKQLEKRTRTKGGAA